MTNPHIGIGILTYCHNEERLNSIKIFFDSFFNVNKGNDKYKIFISDDNSPYLPYKEYLINLQKQHKHINIILNSVNKGIAINTNRCLKLLVQSNSYYMFVLNDDIQFLGKDGLFEAYSYLLDNSGQHHFSWNIDKGNKRNLIGKFDNHTVYSYAGTNGVLLAMDRKCIDTIGGFIIPPTKWGLEHVNYTDRAFEAKLCEKYPDFEESSSYMTLIDSKSPFCEDERNRNIKMNAMYYGSVARQGLFSPILCDI